MSSAVSELHIPHRVLHATLDPPKREDGDEDEAVEEQDGYILRSLGHDQPHPSKEFKRYVPLPAHRVLLSLRCYPT
jgi:hypothetical protein